MVWAMTLVLWFLFLQKRDLHNPAHRMQAVLLLLPSLWSLYLCWSGRPAPRAGKIADYLWFLAVVVLLGIWGFPFSPLALFGSTRGAPWISPLDGVLGGMTFMVLVVYGTYLFFFIPIPGKHQSFADRMKQWREFVGIMAERFHDTPGNRAGLAALSAVLVGIFLLHAWVAWMSTGMVTGLAVSTISLWAWVGGAEPLRSR